MGEYSQSEMSNIHGDKLIDIGNTSNLPNYPLSIIDAPRKKWIRHKCLAFSPWASILGTP